MTKTHIGEGVMVFSHMKAYLAKRREAREIPRSLIWGAVSALGTCTLWLVFIMHIVSESQNIH